MELFRPVKWARNIDWRLTQVWWVDFMKDGVLFYKSMGYNGHMGLDYAWPYSGNIIPCYSAHDWTVVFAGTDGGWGNHIKIQHSDGFVTNYAHLSEIRVKKWEKVKAMQEIGLIWTSGNSTAVHLHFGLMPPKPNLKNWFKGYIDPTPYITDWKESVQTRIDKFADKYWIRKRGEHEYYNCREVLSILSLMEEDDETNH